MKLFLNNFSDIQDFTHAAARCACDIELKSGKYIVDAKSILGIFSLDLSKPVELIINGHDEQFESVAKQFEVE